MLSEDTADCLALANTAILMRLIEQLIERGAVARPTLLLQDAVTDLEGCPNAAHVSRRDPTDQQGVDAAAVATGANQLMSHLARRPPRWRIQAMSLQNQLKSCDISPWPQPGASLPCSCLGISANFNSCRD
jgi:hypothetical protein